MSDISAPKKLWENTLNRLVEALDLDEEYSESGGPYMRLESQAPMFEGEVGSVRRFTGGPLFQLVTCSISVPPIQLDSHMMFAFMPSQSAVPHFTLDSVKAGDHCAFHLDLIPRLDLGAHLNYMDEVFTPLTEALKAGNSLEGLSEAQLDPRQYAVMSPWMFVARATEQAFENVGETVDSYLDHWLKLVSAGISPESLKEVREDDLAVRDVRNKAIIFDPSVDKVWDQIGGLVGDDASETIRQLLKQTS